LQIPHGSVGFRSPNQDLERLPGSEFIIPTIPCRDFCPHSSSLGISQALRKLGTSTHFWPFPPPHFGGQDQ